MNNFTLKSSISCGFVEDFHPFFSDFKIAVWELGSQYSSGLSPWLQSHSSRICKKILRAQSICKHISSWTDGDSTEREICYKNENDLPCASKVICSKNTNKAESFNETSRQYFFRNQLHAKEAQWVYAHALLHVVKPMVLLHKLIIDMYYWQIHMLIIQPRKKY